jgi:hypothetical protein
VVSSWLLVHSPLLGPASWAPVAARLGADGDGVIAPDLRPSLSAGTGYARRQASIAAESVAEGPVVLAAHSGAGPLLPVVVSALQDRGVSVSGAVLVDAGLPHPGRSRRSSLPTELAAHLDTLAVDGWLPPWPKWWPPDALAALVPDSEQRTQLANDCPPLPAALFDEPMPHGAELPGAAYVLLSDAYTEQAAVADLQGWPVVRLAADHLALMTRPDDVIQAIRDAVSTFGR